MSAQRRGKRRRPATQALRVPAFRYWLAVQLLSGCGSMMVSVALAWIVVDAGGTPIELALIVGAQFLPTLLFGPLAGRLSDTFGARRILIIAALTQAGIATALAVVVFVDGSHIGVLFVLSTLGGLAFAADQPARQLLVYDLVGSRLIAAAVALNEVSVNAARIVGPGIAGFILALADASVCFLIASGTFLPAVILLVALKPRRASLRRLRAQHGVTGLRFVWRDKPTFAVLLIAVCVGPVYNVSTSMPIMINEVFEAGGSTYGALLATFGLGALPGAIIAALRPGPPSGRELTLHACLTGVAAGLCALAPALPWLFISIAVVGATSILLIARSNAFVLLRAPAGMKGQAMGAWSMALPGLNPVTQLAVGVLISVWGARVGYGAAGAILAIVALLAFPTLCRAQPRTPAWAETDKH